MKRLSLGVISVGCLLIQSAYGTLLFSDGFNYNTGALGGNVNSGSGAAWTGNANITVASGNLTYAGLQDLGGNELSVVWGGVTSGSSINSPAFATAVSSGQIYYSFLLDMTALPSANTYLTALNPAGTNPGGSGDDIDIYINSTGAMSLRTKGTYSSTTTLSLNSTYLVVMELDYTANLASLYLNPVAGDSQPTATLSATPGGALTAVQDVGFKAQTASTTGTFLIDNLLIGTTWADVTPAAVPEPATITFAGLGVLGLVFARRMRK